MPRLRRMLFLLLCVWPSIALGQTQSASTKDNQPSRQNGKPCVSTEAAQEVLRLGRSLGYPDDQIVEAYGGNPCATLDYLRQEAQQKSSQPTSPSRVPVTPESVGATPAGPTPPSDASPPARRYWFERAPSPSELIVDLSLVLLALAIVIMPAKWIARIPLPNPLKEFIKWVAIGFLAREVAAFLVSFTASFGKASRWYHISPGTQNVLMSWVWIAVIGSVIVYSKHRKKRRGAAQLEQTGAKGVSVP